MNTEGFTPMTLPCFANKVFVLNLWRGSAKWMSCGRSQSPESGLVGADNRPHYYKKPFFWLYHTWPVTFSFSLFTVFFPSGISLKYIFLCLLQAFVRTTHTHTHNPDGRVCVCVWWGLLSTGECLENRFLWRWRHQSNTDLAINLDVTVITKSL